MIYEAENNKHFQMHRKEQNAQKQGGDGKRGGVSMHEEMHKLKWLSVKRVDGVGVCLIFERMLFQG